MKFFKPSQGKCCEHLPILNIASIKIKVSSWAHVVLRHIGVSQMGNEDANIEYFREIQGMPRLHRICIERQYAVPFCALVYCLKRNGLIDTGNRLVQTPIDFCGQQSLILTMSYLTFP